MLCRLICVLLFVAWTAERPVEFDTQLYLGLWRSWFSLLGPLFVSIPGLSLWLWQLIVYALIPVAALWPGAWRKRSGAMDAALLVSLGSMMLSLVWGVARGGSAYNAYYQLWRFAMALAVGFLLACAVRSARDLKLIGLTVVAAAVVRGTLGIYFFHAYVKDKLQPAPEYVITHDDSLLFVAAILIVSCWAVMRGKLTAYLGAALVSLDTLYALIVNDRRIAWVELMFGVALLFVMSPRRWRRKATRLSLLAAPLLVAYVVVGSSRPEPIFSPARSLASVGSDEDPSTLARQEEARNLLYTMVAVGNPLFGTGWGVPYEKITSVYANFGDEWWQYRYLPHNSLLGVCVYSGFVGLAGMWLVVPMAAFLASRGYWNSAGAVERAAALSSLCILPAYSTHCYGDIGLQSLTCNVLLGTALGVASKVAAWSEAAPAGVDVISRVEPAPAGPAAPWSAHAARTVRR
jgi:hypothetical protein